ncbi:retrovirus-related pol polyprotein from transposon TNT 1-94 [Tanacetum coccineum]
MEGLHVAIEDAVAQGSFKDLRVGDGDVHILHLFYIDDVMFMGEWDDTNITNLIIILDCFYLVSGLHINLHKSKLYGVGTALEDVEQCSGAIGCSDASLPFTYLGLPIGSNMNRRDNWDELILKVQKKLMNWKIMLLSIRGSDDLKKKLAKNNEATMVIYNALPRKEYERIFMCNTAKEIWKTLLITHQGNNQVKDNKIDLLVQQYEQFVISEDESIDSAFARFNTIITSLKALDEGYSSKNYVRKFLRALHPKWRANVTAIEESKDLTSLSLDELIENLKVYEMIIKKVSEIVKAKGERQSLALKLRKNLVMRSVRLPEVKMRNTPLETSRSSLREESDSSEQDDEKVKDKTCLVAQASSEVSSESFYFSDENSSIDDLVLDNKYDKLCKMSLKIIIKNKRLKATRNSLEKELSIIKEKVSTLEKNKGVDLECVKCHMLKIDNEKLKEEAIRLIKFKMSTHCLNEMLSNQKPSGEKLGLGFNSFEASSSGTKEIKFVKAQKKVFSDGGPINMSGPYIVQATPKEIMGPPVITPGSEKSVSFQKSILGPIPKYIIVNNVKVLVASDNEICLGVDLEPDEWIKDSGCSKHMTGNRKLFSSYKAYNEGNVIFGSNLRGNIIGKGTILNDSLKIDNVEHVDNLRFNLLSVGQICDNKCRVTFSEHDSEITKDGKVIGRGIRKKGLYVMKLGNKPKDQICLATIDENSTLWHRRLGHANMRLIQSLASKELVRNLPKLKFDQHFCDACKIGKQAHASHKAKNIVSTTRCLELLHMDLFGPSAVRSYGGNRYTLVIVDDYSRYTWTRFLKDKTEAFDQLEIFSKKNQNQLGCTIVSIRTDHGREFDNEVQFGEFCNANGITHNFSAPRTPQSNGVVERKNKTLQEMSRTMLNEQSLPQKFWCNAVDTSTYILNRILIKVILGKTPYELLRGYSQNSKAYIILNKHTRKVEESLNVTFDETPLPSKTSPLVDDELDEEEEIKNVSEALMDDSWIVAMQEELNQFIANDVWELVPQPRNMTIIGTKWVFRNKLDENVARLESIRILLTYAYALDFKLFQMDIKTAFLNGFINEEVYVAQPPGFIDFEKPDHVYKLKKALYGLKQAPKAWYDRLKAFLIKHEYKMGMFEMSMMGELNFFLGLQIKQMEDGIFFNQSKYIKEMLKKFGLEESKPMKTPMSSDTKLTKDEECESVDSTKYRGMIGTTHLGLWYPKGTGIETVVYADSDHAGDYVDQKSTSGICTFVGCCLTSWFSKKQTALAISTTEAEYVSAEKACQQALWSKQALIDYDVRHDDVPIMCDNKGAIDLIKNPVQHSRTKHIEICHHFLRDNVQKGHISIEKVSSVDNIVDILTKHLKRGGEFAQILDIPCEGACVFTDKWSLDELAFVVPRDGPYQTNPPSPDDIISYI